MQYQPLVIGVDDFEEIIDNNNYFVDKTRFIVELLDKKGKVSLFTYPRMFGKNLTLSMIKYHFEDIGDEEQNKRNAELFSGLAIVDIWNTDPVELKAWDQQEEIGYNYRMSMEVIRACFE